MTKGKFKGDGVAEDQVQASPWFKVAADNGNKYAQSTFGVRYELGKGIEQSLEQAAHYYQLSADQGYEDAMSASCMKWVWACPQTGIRRICCISKQTRRVGKKPGYYASVLKKSLPDQKPIQ